MEWEIYFCEAHLLFEHGLKRILFVNLQLILAALGPCRSYSSSKGVMIDGYRPKAFHILLI